jgi:hypothetical protein
VVLDWGLPLKTDYSLSSPFILSHVSVRLLKHLEVATSHDIVKHAVEVLAVQSLRRLFSRWTQFDPMPCLANAVPRPPGRLAVLRKSGVVDLCSAEVSRSGRDHSLSLTISSW